MHTRRFAVAVLLWTCGLGAIVAYPTLTRASSQANERGLVAATAHAAKLIKQGQRIFRYDTFGDEQFWGGELQLHRAIAGARFGGVGPGLSPAQALGVGLKVDSDALPSELLRAIRAGTVNLKDPATTLTLLRLNSVVGLTGFFDGPRLSSVGIQCSLCHSDVDNRVAPGIGRRRDGWPNRDLNVGAIIALAPDLSPLTSLLGLSDATLRSVLKSWGPGRFDASVILDGKAFRPDGKTAAVMIPAAFGLAGVNLHTNTGWGGVSHWNAFVANLEMHGQGTFYDPRLNDEVRFPVAARAGFGNVRAERDLITSKLPALQLYQLALEAPKPPEGSFDREAARNGKRVFNGRARCATATFRRSSPSLAGTCTRRPRSASTIFRRSARRMATIARRRSVASSRG